MTNLETPDKAPAKRKKPKRRWWEIETLGVARCISACHTVNRFTNMLGVHYRQVYFWKRIPERHLAVIQKNLGIHPAELRPDLFHVDGTRKAIPPKVKKKPRPRQTLSAVGKKHRDNYHNYKK